MHNFNDDTRNVRSDQTDTFLDEKDLAQRWKLSPRTLQNTRVAGGGVKYLKIGKSVRYRLSDVEAYEAARERQDTTGGQK